MIMLEKNDTKMTQIWHDCDRKNDTEMTRKWHMGNWRYLAMAAPSGGGAGESSRDVTRWRHVSSSYANEQKEMN